MSSRMQTVSSRESSVCVAPGSIEDRRERGAGKTPERRRAAKAPPAALLRRRGSGKPAGRDGTASCSVQRRAVFRYAFELEQHTYLWCSSSLL